MRLFKPWPIFCPECGQQCGVIHPAHISMHNGGCPEEWEGIGENFVYNDKWYCSQKCLDAAKAADAEPEEPDS